MSETLGFRPLYQQVRGMFLRRIADGTWAPGDALPNEHALALELGVSQGTVRKALDSLAAENLVERRQVRLVAVERSEQPPKLVDGRGHAVQIAHRAALTSRSGSVLLY